MFRGAIALIIASRGQSSTCNTAQVLRWNSLQVMPHGFAKPLALALVNVPAGRYMLPDQCRP